jgi:glucan phosphoethanolaminetransferase (alkaline phosphatase superfamily)
MLASMKTLKTIIFVLLLAFFITLLIMIINLDRTYSWVLNNQEIVKYMAITALLMFSVYAFVHYLTRSSLERKIKKLEKENSEVKAKFYDIRQDEERIDKELKSFGESLPKKDPPEDPKLLE